MSSPSAFSTGSRAIPLWGNGQAWSCEAYWIFSYNQIELALIGPFGRYHASGLSLFHAFLVMRMTHLEPDGWPPLCMGARYDAWVRPAPPTDPRVLIRSTGQFVDLFEPEKDVRLLASVNDQMHYRRSSTQVSIDAQHRVPDYG